MIFVSKFVLEGVTLVSETELLDALAPLTNQEIPLATLQSLDIITTFYAENDFLARALLPEQDIIDGVVRIKVIEGSLGQIVVNNEGQRVQEERVMGFFDQEISAGDPMNLSQLTRALSILSSQPGLDFDASLSAGEEEAGVDINVTTRDTPLLDFGAGITNLGLRSTGELQAILGLNVFNPLGLFDEAVLLSTLTEGSHFILGDYNPPIGYSGLRVGTSFSHLDYEIVQESLKE